MSSREPLEQSATEITARAAGSFDVFIATNEDRVRRPSGAIRGEYKAEWGTGYRSRTFDILQAGDLVDASMTATPAGWQLTFHDQRQRRNFTLLVEAPSANDPSVEADWWQVDPTGTAGYLSSIGFRDVEVNGSVPKFTRITTSWMSAPGTPVFGPSAIRRGAFQIRPVQLTRWQEQYLSDMERLAIADQPYMRKAQACGAPYGPAFCAADLTAEAVALHVAATDQFDRLVSNQDWPSGGAAPIKQWVTTDQSFNQLMLASVGSRSHLSGEQLSALEQGVNADEQPESELIEALGLPYPNPPAVGSGAAS